MEQKLFSENWENQLELQFISDDPSRVRAYICSPLKADTSEEYLLNMYAARAYMFYAKEKLGYAACAPHAYLPMLLGDNNRSDRALAIHFGLKLLERSQVLLVCGNRMSFGMRGEIAYAGSLKKRIIVFDERLLCEVRKIVGTNRSVIYSAVLLKGHPAMAHPRPQIQY